MRSRPSPSASTALDRNDRRPGFAQYRLPRPLRLNLTLAALLTTVSVADRLLLRAGVKLYCTVQLWPAVNAVVAAHVPLRAKSPGFDPPAVSEPMVSVPPPVLVSVTVLAALVVPTL